MAYKQPTKVANPPKDKVANNQQSIKAPKGKAGGPTTDDRAKWGRNMAQVKAYGM